MIRQDLAHNDIPTEPGVYFWKDANGTILYIGKATSLRDRIRSYFAPDLIKTRGAHIVDMVFTATDISWQTTPSVLEALILEANLIKKHQPYYNTKEKDDKSFNCVVITKEEYPRVLLVRQKDINTTTKTVTAPKLGLHSDPYDAVFGPYPSGSAIREALKIIRKILPFRDRISAQKDKEVFYRQIGLTPDLSNAQAKDTYRATIASIKLILQGKLRSLVVRFTKEMNALAKKQQFEQAQTLKQKIFALEHIQDISLIKRDLISGDTATSFRIEAYDIAHTSGSHMVGVMTVVEHALTQKGEYRKFTVRGFSKANDPGALREILVRRLAHTEWPYPQLIVVDGNLIQSNVAQTVLRELELDIPVVAVTKDERHRPKSLSGDKAIIDLHKYAILLANNEAHRFAIGFHKAKRGKAMLY